MTDYDKIWVRVSHATKKFATRKGEVTALEDVNLEIHDGQFVCLLGPSGCGKTTLLRMIGGLDVPTSDTITIDGKVVDGPSPKMTMVFQEYSLYPWRTVAENVGFGLEMNGVPVEERQVEVMKELKLVGLENLADSYPYELSGDAQTRNKMQRELLNIWQKTGKTILFVTHSVDEAVYLSDKVVILTPRSGTVHEITLPRPRDRTSVEFAQIRKNILHIIEELETGNQNI